VAAHRPDYAKAAVRWALEPAPGARVLDLGAGTGKLTATLIALGAEVIARVPGGILAGLWNVLDNWVDWVAGLERVSGSAAVGPRDTFSSWRAATANPETTSGEFTLPMLTGVLRVHRL
jgi:hypothetical protein